MKQASVTRKCLNIFQILTWLLALTTTGGFGTAERPESAHAQEKVSPAVEAPGARNLKVMFYTEVTSFMFMPARTAVVVGDTVTFTNYDAVPQRLTLRQVLAEALGKDEMLIEIKAGMGGMGGMGPASAPLEQSSPLLATSLEPSDHASHTSALSSRGLVTPILQPKESFSHRFTAPGTYEAANADYGGGKTTIVVSEQENEEGRQSYAFSQSVMAEMESMMLDEPANAGGGTGTGAGAPRAVAAVPGTTCPTSAPVKTFTILAIDVDITLNRFGIHDPQGKMYVLEENLAAVRAQETAALPGRVSTGLRDDPIQPLVIRANLGDCVNVTFKNQLGGGKPASMSIHRGAVDPSEDGSEVGNNTDSVIESGNTTTYTWFLEDIPELEGTMYLNSHGDIRAQTNHGLFGALIAEPKGSSYLHPATGQPLKSGWEAMIVPPTGPAFREFAIIYHEVGDETYILKDAQGGNVPLIDVNTEVYRPNARALNYRSEPHGLRLSLGGDESQAYGSYAFGDPPTPMPRSYMGDPYKTRLLHGGSEVFHSHHYHGGTVRWPANPKADPTFATQFGLNKTPPINSQSLRLDVQTVGPGESYNLEHECVSGGCQMQAGEFLYHCHFPHHYVGGMWSFYRVLNTLQSDLRELPDRQGLIGQAVNSLGLIGKAIPSGRVLTRDTLDAWVESLLPPPGVTSGYDATVYDWVKEARPQGSLYFKEPEDTRTWVNFSSATPGQRPEIKFDPNTGLLEFPFLTPHLGKRPPFAPGAHGPAPYLTSPVSENNLPTNSDFTTVPADPNRPNDALCPAGSPVKRYNVVGIQIPIAYNSFGEVDAGGQIYVLAEEKQDVLAGRKPATNLIIRANVRDCVYVTYVSEMVDNAEVHFFSKTNMHPHFFQFDTQASDGVITGFSFEQSLRPYPTTESRALTSAANAGQTQITVNNVTNLRTGIWIGVGLGTNGIELHKIASISGTTITLLEPLVRAHAIGEAVGVEFVRYAWYPDVNLSTVFWHDHVYGTTSWGHGLTAATIVEPQGSTYHDPTTGQEIRSGPLADIHTTNPVDPNQPGFSFREMSLMPQDSLALGGNGFNLRREPFFGRLTRTNDPSLIFSSVTHGDPPTPLLRAYQRDPVVIRVLQAATNEAHVLRVTGHRFRLERFGGAPPRGTSPFGVAERFDLFLEGGAGRAGDYLYYNPQADHLQEGEWGLIRVHDTLRSDLRSLPGGPVPPGGAGFPTLTRTGGRPPAPSDPGNPCPAGAPLRTLDVVAMQTTITFNRRASMAAAGHIFALAQDEADIAAGRKATEPLVLRAAAGECLEVNLANHLAGDRVSLNAGALQTDPQRSSGITAGFNFDQSVAPGQSRTYRLFADVELGPGILADFGHAPTSWDQGLYGAIVVAPTGSRFLDPASGSEIKAGWQAVVRPASPNILPYRDFTLLFQSEDNRIGKNVMPYPQNVSGRATLNYRTEPLGLRLGRNADTSRVFSTRVHGDPETPILQAHAGDPVRINALEGSDPQTQTFFVNGHRWNTLPGVSRSETLSVQVFGPHASARALLNGGAGGNRALKGDYLLGNHRLPFLEAGQWGILRVLERGDSAIQSLPNNAPVAAADAVSVLQNTTGNFINVLANDTDPNGNPVTILAVTQGISGTVAIGPNNASVLYTPNSGFAGADTFTYTVSDGQLSASGTVVVTVNIVHPPVAVSDTAAVVQNSTGNVINVLANDSDPDANPIIVTAVTQGASGSTSIGTAGANVVYTPTLGFAGTDAFAYTISDGSLIATANVTVTVSAANRAPVAVNDTAAVPQNSTGDPIGVLTNDSDPDGNPIRVTAAGPAASGTVAIGPGATTVLYTPNAGFSGADTFTYTISDGALTATATVNITVQVSNQAPVGGNDAVSVTANSASNPINVLANDADPEANPIRVTAVSPATNGSVTVGTGGANIVYTPNPGFIGADSFTYTVSDGVLTSNVTVNVTVGRGNRAPTPASDAAIVAMNSVTNTINVLANDSDPDADSTSITAVTQGLNGSVTIGAGGANVVYTPNAGFTGTDTFTYTVGDGVLTATANVTVSVRRAASRPVALDDTATVGRNSTANQINVLANDSDPAADPISVTAVTQGASGTVAIGTGGASVLYTPATGFVGADNFTYTISDGVLTATANVTITVLSTNRAPLAVNDSLTVLMDSTNNPINIEANDSDPDGNPLTIVAVSAAARGTVTIGAGATTLFYTPNPGFHGTDLFTYTISDGALTASGVVTIIVRQPAPIPRVYLTMVQKAASGAW